jgi:hypothetical protein
VTSNNARGGDGLPAGHQRLDSAKEKSSGNELINSMTVSRLLISELSSTVLKKRKSPQQGIPSSKPQELPPPATSSNSVFKKAGSSYYWMDRYVFGN